MFLLTPELYRPSYPHSPNPDFLTLVGPGSLDYRRDPHRPHDPARRLRPRGARKDFLREKVAEDVASGRFGRPIHTRFPPEPNGYLHIGHAKSICLNFGIAARVRAAAATCGSTTPTRPPRTSGTSRPSATTSAGSASSGTRSCFASDYFERLYEIAERWSQAGKAYVESQSEEEIRERRGTVTAPGTPSPYRDRPVEENLDLLAPDAGRRVPRRRPRAAGPDRHGASQHDDAGPAAAPDPPRRALPPRHAWCIYPLYDFAHGLSDAFEGITHSLCTLEFKDNRELYDWLVREAGFERPPEQTEFARLELDYTVLSKRKLLQAGERGARDGLGRSPDAHLAGIRRRGVTPEAIRDFADTIGVARSRRADRARRVRACRPRRPQHAGAPGDGGGAARSSWCSPTTPRARSSSWTRRTTRTTCRKTGSRTVPFSRELWIERDDFMEDPPKKFFRLAPGREVRLRYGYFMTCTDVVKDAAGEVVELRCTYDPATRGGDAPDGRKVQGTIHWVSAPARARLRAAAVRPAVHGARIPTPCRRAGLRPVAQSRTRWWCSRAPRSSRAWRRIPPGPAISSSGRAISSATRGFQAWRAGVQPDGDAAGLVGEGARTSQPSLRVAVSPAEPRVGPLADLGTCVPDERRAVRHRSR